MYQSEWKGHIYIWHWKISKIYQTSKYCIQKQIMNTKSWDLYPYHTKYSFLLSQKYPWLLLINSNFSAIQTSQRIPFWGQISFWGQKPFWNLDILNNIKYTCNKIMFIKKCFMQTDNTIFNIYFLNNLQNKKRGIKHNWLHPQNRNVIWIIIITLF